MWVGRSLALEIGQARPIWTTQTQLAKVTKVGTKAQRQIFTRGTLGTLPPEFSQVSSPPLKYEFKSGLLTIWGTDDTHACPGLYVKRHACAQIMWGCGHGTSGHKISTQQHDSMAYTKDYKHTQ